MTAFPVYRWGKVFKATILKDFLPNLKDFHVNIHEDDGFVLTFLTSIRSLYVSKEPYYCYRWGRPGSICTNMKLRSRWEDCKRAVDFIENFDGGKVFAPKGREVYFMRNYWAVFYQAMEQKEYALMNEIYSTPRFYETVKDTKGLRGYLWRHRKFKTYRLLRNLKDKFRRK